MARPNTLVLWVLSRKVCNEALGSHITFVTKDILFRLSVRAKCVRLVANSAANGRGFHFLDVLGEVLHWGGQLLVSFVLVGLAYGWTLSSKAVQKLIPDDKVSQDTFFQSPPNGLMDHRGHAQHPAVRFGNMLASRTPFLGHI